MDIDSMRRYIAETIGSAGLLPDSAVVAIHPAHAEATAFHCQWSLAVDGADSKKHSREITVQVGSAAMKALLSADTKGCADMLVRLVEVIGIRLQEGNYDPAAATLEPFIVSIDEHSLD